MKKLWKKTLLQFRVQIILVTFALTLIPLTASGELLSRIGPVDNDALETIKGEWVVKGRSYTLVFTTDYACRVDGVKYFHYSRAHAKTPHPWVYTIIKSNTTGRWYFARGNYRNGRFYGTTSRFMFESKDSFTVFSEKDPDEVYLRAVRYKDTRGAKNRKSDKKSDIKSDTKAHKKKKKNL